MKKFDLKQLMFGCTLLYGRDVHSPKPVCKYSSVVDFQCCWFCKLSHTCVKV